MAIDWGALAQVAGNYAGGVAQGNLQQAGANQNQANAAANLYRTQLQAAIQAPSAFTSQAVRGDIIGNGQDAQISGLPSWITMPQISGGLRPSMLGAGSKTAGAALQRNAINNLLSNKFSVPNAPTLEPMPQTGAGTKALGYLGLAGSLLDTSGYGGKVNGLLGGHGASTFGDYGPTNAQLGYDPTAAAGNANPASASDLAGIYDQPGSLGSSFDPASAYSDPGVGGENFGSYAPSAYGDSGLTGNVSGVSRGLPIGAAPSFAGPSGSVEYINGIPTWSLAGNMNSGDLYSGLGDWVDSFTPRGGGGSRGRTPAF